MDPWDRHRDDDTLRRRRERDQRERDRLERDRLERDRLERDRLDDEWDQHVADRIADDVASAGHVADLMQADRDRILREESARSARRGRLQVWPESGTELPSSVLHVDPLDLTTYVTIDFRHPTVEDLSASLVGRFHPDDGGDLALVWPTVVTGHRVVRREQVPDAWTWVSVEGTPFPLAIRREAGLILLSWQDPALMRRG